MKTSKTPPHLHQIMRTVLHRFPEIGVAFLFGSLARGDFRPDSDLDLGVAGARPLSAEQRLEVVLALSEAVALPSHVDDPGDRHRRPGHHRAEPDQGRSALRRYRRPRDRGAGLAHP